MVTLLTSSYPGYPLPRLGTLRNPDRPTFGRTVAQYHLAINRAQMMPHQRYIADVAGEVDPETLRRVYDTILLEMPRQNAKTNTVEAQMMAASRRPLEWAVNPETGELEAVGDQLARRVVLYLAQDRLMARERLITDLVEGKLERNPLFRGRFKARKSNGSERITWNDSKARIMVQSSDDTAAHSLTTDDAFLDESFAHRDLTIVNAVQPTMLTRPDPQLWVISTKGEGDDGLLQHYEEIAAAAVHDPDTRVAVFVWEAEEDDDRADPAVWRRVMPALGRTITEDRVRSLLTTTPAAEFDRAYLNRRPTVATVAALDVAAWGRCANQAPPSSPAGPIVVGIDLDPERAYGNVAVAFGAPVGVGAIVDRRPGTAWIVGAVLELVHRAGVTVFEVWGDRRAGVGGILDQLAGRGLPIHETTAGDVASAAGDLYDLTRAGAFVHDDQSELNDAVTGGRRRTLGEAWTFDKLNSPKDVAPLNAVTLAVAGYRHHFPVGLAGGIR